MIRLKYWEGVNSKWQKVVIFTAVKYYAEFGHDGGQVVN